MSKVQLDWEDLPDFFGPRELAKLLGVGVNNAYAFARHRGFPAFRVGRRIRISKAALRRFLEDKAGFREG